MQLEPAQTENDCHEYRSPQHGLHPLKHETLARIFGCPVVPHRKGASEIVVNLSKSKQGYQRASVISRDLI